MFCSQEPEPSKGKWPAHKVTASWGQGQSEGPGLLSPNTQLFLRPQAKWLGSPGGWEGVGRLSVLPATLDTGPWDEPSPGGYVQGPWALAPGS